MPFINTTYVIGQSVTPLTTGDMYLLGINADELPYGYIDSMIRRFAGKTCTIKEIRKELIKINDDGYGFSWHASMFRESYKYALVTPIYNNVLSLS